MKVVGVIAGVLTGILGVYAMCVPFRTFLGIGWMIGILLLVNGAEMVIVALSGKKKNVAQCVLGVIGAVIGLIILFSGVQRVLTDVMAAYLIGFSIIVYGIYQLVSGGKHYKEEKGASIWKIICGVLSVLVGAAAVGHPFLTMVSVGYMIAFSLIIQGIDIIMLSLSIGKMNKDE